MRTKDKASEYLFTFKSVLLSFAVFEYIKLFAILLKSKDPFCFLTPPFFFSFAYFITLIEYWWNSYHFHDKIAKNIYWFILFLIEPIIFYLAAVLLNPEINVDEFSNEIFIHNYFKFKVMIFLLSSFQLLIFIINNGKFSLTKANIVRYIVILILLFSLFIDNITYNYLVTILLLAFAILYLVFFWRDLDRILLSSNEGKE